MIILEPTFLTTHIKTNQKIPLPQFFEKKIKSISSKRKKKPLPAKVTTVIITNNLWFK